MSDVPLLEFDPEREAIIEPATERLETTLPERCVLCFFPEVLGELATAGRLVKVAHIYSEMGLNPVYRLEADGHPLAVAHPGVGGPLAAFFLESLIASGARTFIAVGGAGVLRDDLHMGHLVVPTAAVRDEGTSYHYMPAGREVFPTPEATAALEAVLTKRGIPYVTGKTWTTDAIFRETRARVARRQAEGCLTVEMEAATFFAVAAFRRVRFGQLLYGGDDLTGEAWDERNWIEQPRLRERLFWLAVEACLRL